MQKNLTILIGILLLTGCARVPDPAASSLSEVVSERSGYDVSWDRKLPSCKEELISCLLLEDLTVESAVQIALLNSPEIQTQFEMIGIAQADLVNASLIANPIFGVAARIPDQQSVLINTEIDALQPIVNILLQPIRKKTASFALAETKAQVAHQFFSFIEEVSSTYYSLQAAIANLELQSELVEVRELEYLLSQKQFDAGNVHILDVNDFLDVYQHAVLDYRWMEIDVNTHWQKLAKLMGISSNEFNIAMQPPIPEVPKVCKKDLLQFAFYQRFDLEAKRLQTDMLAASFGLYRWWAYTDFIAGVAYESEPEGARKIGPGFAFRIPIFNYGQGNRLRVCAEFNQSYQMYLDMVLEMTKEVNTFYKGMNISKERLDELATIVLPDHDMIINQTLRLYNFMNARVYDLLDAKAAQINTKMMIADTTRDYLIYRANLTLAVGGELP